MHSPFPVIWRLVCETVRRWNENDGNLLAASMAYYAAFSFFPLILVLISGLGFALRFSSGARDSEQELLKLLSQNVAPAIAEQVNIILNDVRINASVTGLIGLAVLMLAAVAMFNQLDFAFDRIWRVEPAAGGIWRTIRRVIGARLKAFLILCALGLVIMSALVLGISLSAVHRWADRWQRIGTAWESVEFLAGVAFHTIVFTLLYKLLPKCKVRVDQCPGRRIVGRRDLGGGPADHVLYYCWEKLYALRRGGIFHRDHGLGLLRQQSDVSRAQFVEVLEKPDEASPADASKRRRARLSSARDRRGAQDRQSVRRLGARLQPIAKFRGGRSMGVEADGRNPVVVCPGGRTVRPRLGSRTAPTGVDGRFGAGRPRLA